MARADQIGCRTRQEVVVANNEKVAGPCDSFTFKGLKKHPESTIRAFPLATPSNLRTYSASTNYVRFWQTKFMALMSANGSLAELPLFAKFSPKRTLSNRPRSSRLQLGYEWLLRALQPPDRYQHVKSGPVSEVISLAENCWSSSRRHFQPIEFGRVGFGLGSG